MATSGFATLVLSDIPVSTVRVSLLGRRKEILHKRWDENVYQPIQDQINRKLNAEYDSFLERKINIYDQYLNVSIIRNLQKLPFFQKIQFFKIQVVNKKSICNSKVGFPNCPRANFKPSHWLLRRKSVLVTVQMSVT